MCSSNVAEPTVVRQPPFPRFPSLQQLEEGECGNLTRPVSELDKASLHKRVPERSTSCLWLSQHKDNTNVSSKHTPTLPTEHVNLIECKVLRTIYSLVTNPACNSCVEQKWPFINIPTFSRSPNPDGKEKKKHRKGRHSSQRPVLSLSLSPCFPFLFLFSFSFFTSGSPLLPSSIAAVFVRLDLNPRAPTLFWRPVPNHVLQAKARQLLLVLFLHLCSCRWPRDRCSAWEQRGNRSQPLQYSLLSA